MKDFWNFFSLLEQAGVAEKVPIRGHGWNILGYKSNCFSVEYGNLYHDGIKGYGVFFIDENSWRVANQTMTPEKAKQYIFENVGLHRQLSLF